MSFWTLILRSFIFNARSHLGTLLGAAIGSAVLIGALVVGDSVKESLRQAALKRLGSIDYAMVTGDRFFRSEFPGDPKVKEHFGETAAACLQLVGSVSTEEGTSRANRVQVMGVDEAFWALSPESKGESASTMSEDNIRLNSALARKLNAKVGDTVLVRIPKPSLLSREMPISPQEDFSTALRLQVAAIVPEEQLGSFSLHANQTVSLNAFVDRKFLQEKVGMAGKANLLLVSSGSTAPEALPTLPAGSLHLDDYQLQFRDVTNQTGFEIRSERVFLDEPIGRAALNASAQAVGILTYFVNELRVETNATPYSMVTAAGSPWIPSGMRDDEIIINQWLADDLKAKTGDLLSLRYFVLADTQQLEEKTNSFRIHSVVPLSGVHADRDLMPEFPGIAKAEKTENWDAGFTIDMKKIRPKDEDYWEKFRGTPKAFITLKAGQEMWASRFGNLTAVRFVSADSESMSREKLEIAATLLKKIDPASVGLRIENVRAHALTAAASAQDFGGLFLGFSFFLIGAALILMGLLFVFSIEQRTEEIGTLLALGFRPKQVRRLLLAEGCLIAAVGGIVGTVGGIVYAQGMLRGLATVWSSAVAGSSLDFHVTAQTILTGLFSSIVVCGITIWLVLRKQARQSARELLAGGDTSQIVGGVGAPGRSWAEWIFAVSAVAGVALIAWALWTKTSASAGIAFGAGSLLLIAGIASTASLLKKIIRSPSLKQLNLYAVALRNASRRRKRSVATVALLASGAFMIMAVGAFRLETSDSEKRTSGTGGFALMGETSLPVVQNLNQQQGRDFFGLDDKLQDLKFVPFRAREGDEASCLNLNRAQRPKLLGVKPELLRDRFAFSKMEKKAENPWELLQRTSYGNSLPDDEVPAIGDAASIQWALGKKIGDTIDYEDDRGNRFKLRLVAGVANSILQGSLIIDESEFVKRFPGESGYRMFLIDTPSKNVEATSQALSRALRDVGLELTPAKERLAQFNAVQNTYLNTFQVLGGLGLLLGSAGLGVVVLRNVLERRSEFGVLTALGFRRRTLRSLVLGEHAALLLLGLAIGISAAVAAVLPSLISPSSEIPYGSLAATLGGVCVVGLITAIAATRWALSGPLLKALRNE